MAGNPGKICRTCLNFIESDNAISINHYAERLSSHHILIKDVIEQCISELDLDVSNDAVICNPCHDALICTYNFKSKCIQTEQRIYSYLEKNNLGLGVKIDLSMVVKSVNSEVEEMIVISDSDSSQEVIRLSDSEYENGEALGTISYPVDSMVIKEDSTVQTYQQNDKESPSTLPVCSNAGYSCAKCQYKMSRKELLEEHLQLSRHAVSKHVCQVCESEGRSTMDRYKRPYVCGLCDRVFTEKGYLRSHILYKHSDLTLPLTCRIENCQSIFRRKSDFNNHIIKHSRYKPFMCQLCNKGFLNESQWDAHLENDHGLCFVGK